jgi:hypothetical protein
MKKLAVIALFALLCAPLGVRAQDALQYTTVGAQHQQQSQESEEPSQPPEAAQPAETTQKPEESQDAGAVIDKMADAFYINCLRKMNPDITQQDLQGLCECTAKRMKTEMTPEQIKIMAQNDEAGRLALNHMLLDIYAPCMNYPVQSRLEKQCHSAPKAENLPAGLDWEKICYCSAVKTGQWYTSHGRELMQAVIAKNPNVYDLTGPIMDDPSFKQAAHDNLTSCIFGGSP